MTMGFLPTAVLLLAFSAEVCGHRLRRTKAGTLMLLPDSEYEYGDREANARNEDSSDYSVHQFLKADDARDGPASAGDDAPAAAAIRRSREMAGQDHFNSENTPSKDEDAFIQLASKHQSKRARKQSPDDDYGDGYEYGDREANARNEDSSDYSVHQFLAVDDARDGPQSDGDDSDTAAQVRRSREMASQDHFNSENTPSFDDDFIQLASKHQSKRARKQSPDDAYGDGYEYGDREANARNEDSSDYSVHQFLAVDDARDGPQSDGDDSDTAAQVRRSREMASQDHFNSENTPSSDDDFIQLALKHQSKRARKQSPDDDYGDGYEYGDREANARNEDSSDYSVHQFLAVDDARDGPQSDGDDSNTAAQVRRSREMASQDHFNSENSPSSDDDFIQLALKHQSKRARKQSPDNDYGDGYEYGDREANARNEDSSDYSVHQFLAVDDARDGPQSDGDDSDTAAQVRRSREMASQDHFNSENTPSADDFIQVALKHQSERVKRQSPEDGYGDGYEYGDREANARNEDSSDYSAHQFLTVDDARDGPQSNGDDGDAAAEVRRSRVMANQDHFNSENTPSADDDFIQLASKQEPLNAKK